MRKMIVVLNQPAREGTFPPDLVVPLKIPALKDKETAR